jgi:hypothetical protein
MVWVAVCGSRTSGGITRDAVFSLGQRNEGLGNAAFRTLDESTDAAIAIRSTC